jgi:predicted Rossmann fold nucleotide-binding protein DprA/Smf involved in DNA uptake
MTLISENTRALLLLTAPLIVGTADGGSTPVLSLSEFNKLARRLKEMAVEPVELLGPARAELLQKLSQVISPERLESLLDRGFQMSQAIETWNARGIWITSRDDSDYPEQLKSKLKEHAPTVIYGCGDKSLLQNGGLAVVGSRDADEQSLDFTQSVGRLAAQAGVTIISGGAKGVDRAAMHGSLEAGGAAVGVLAEQLLRMAVAPDCREPIQEGRLALVSLVDPAARFNVGNAMQRNKIIYGLADAALVVSSDVNKGGTWAGAIEQLERFKSCAVYVRTNSGAPDGNRELQSRGALPWPQPETADELTQAIKTPAPSSEAFTTDSHLPLFAMEKH